MNTNWRELRDSLPRPQDAGSADHPGNDVDESLRRLEAVNISIAVWEDGSMKVTQSKSDQRQALKDGGTVYSPADMWHFIQLDFRERRLLHGFKRQFGGKTEWSQ